MVTAIDCSKWGPDLIVSASNDCSVRLWDLRSKSSVLEIKDSYPLLAVAFELRDTQKFFAGGIENLVKKWDIRSPDGPIHVFEGHTDSITSLKTNSEGGKMLTNSMDNTVRCWDTRPLCLAENRCLKVYSGHSHGYENNILRADWSMDHKLVATGSSDHQVYVWNATNRQIKIKLGGHQAVVNCVRFSPINNVLASASNDKTIIISDLPDLI